MIAPGVCKPRIPEKEKMRNRLARILFCGDEKVWPRKERKAMLRKMATNQNEEKPRRKNIPPARWAPTVPKRLWASPARPDLSQNRGSAGW